MPKQEESLLDKVRSSLPLIYLIVGLLALRWTFVEPYVVPTGSMEPTLKTGDRLYALKCAYDVRIPFTDVILFRTGKVNRGDVILFRAPRDPDITYVKRAVGLPGDRLEFRNGVMYVNGQEMIKDTAPDRQVMYDIEREDSKTLYVENLTGVKHFVILDQERSLMPGRTMDEIVVPPDHLFAVGDNRDNSHDSRAWGFVPMQNLKGKGMFIWYSGPVDPPGDESLVEKIFKAAVDFISVWKWHPRFERIGTLIH